jgi:hypothetical protein
MTDEIDARKSECLVCGEPLSEEALRAWGSFCSKDCEETANDVPDDPYESEWVRDPIDWRRPREDEVQCKMCGYPYRHQENAPTGTLDFRRLCSWVCSDAHDRMLERELDSEWKAFHEGEERPKPRLTERHGWQCRHCSDVFTTGPVERGSLQAQSFCSQRCAREWARKMLNDGKRSIVTRISYAVPFLKEEIDAYIAGGGIEREKLKKEQLERDFNEAFKDF